MDKADASARTHIAATADLVGAIRLPEGSFRTDAGTDVVVDILFFRKRLDASPPEAMPGSTSQGFAVRPKTKARSASTSISSSIRRWCSARTLSPRARTAKPILACHVRALIWARRSPPRSCAFRNASTTASRKLSAPVTPSRRSTVGATNAGSSIREGSYFIGANGALVQMVDGEAVTIKIRKGRSTDGIFEKHARIIRKLIPIRDAVREILQMPGDGPVLEAAAGPASHRLV